MTGQNTQREICGIVTIKYGPYSDLSELVEQKLLRSPRPGAREAFGRTMAATRTSANIARACNSAGSALR